MVYDEMYEMMLDRIIAYSNVNKKFNGYTFQGIKNNYDEYSNFTERQKSAILNVYNKWKIENWYNNQLLEQTKCSSPICEACSGTGVSYWGDDVYGKCFNCNDIN